MFDLELSEEQQMIRESVASFARAEVRPIARDSDERGAIPPAALQKGFDLGVIHSALPEEFGGYGETRSALTGAIVAEELAYGDLAFAIYLLAPRLAAFPILDLGSADQKKKYLPAFSEAFCPATAAIVEPRFDFDLSHMATRALEDGNDYVLNGKKCFVPLADEARILVVLAQLGESSDLGAFVVDRGAPGLEIGEREKNMGIKGVPTFEVCLNALRLPKSALLAGSSPADSTRFVNQSRVALSAMAVGVARAAFDYARDYAKERTAFGVAIAQKQAIAFMLADMAIEVDASRMLTWEAAWKLDRGEDATREAVLAKRYSSTAALKITDNAVQVLGGHGYVRDHPVEMWLRNARGFSSFEGLATI